MRRLRTPLVLSAVAALAACAPVAYEVQPGYGGQPYSAAPSLPPPVPRAGTPPAYGWDGRTGTAPQTPYAPSYGGSGPYAAPPYANPPYGGSGPYAAQPYAPPSYPGQPYATQPYPGQTYPGPSPQAGTSYRDERTPYPAQPYPDGGSYVPPSPYRDDGDRYGYRPENAPGYGQPDYARPAEPPYGAPYASPDPGGSGNPPIQRDDVAPPSLGAPTWR